MSFEELEMYIIKNGYNLRKVWDNIFATEPQSCTFTLIKCDRISHTVEIIKSDIRIDGLYNIINIIRDQKLKEILE